MEKEKLLDDVCCVQKTLLCGFKSAIDSGLMNVDTKEAGEVADIIKDLAETEKNIREAVYYESVTKAMEDASVSYGYTPTRVPKMNQMNYTEAYLRDPNQFKHDMHMGYTDIPKYGMEYNEYDTAKKYYTTTGDMSGKNDMRTHGKRYFTETIENMKEIWDDADPTQKAELKEHLKELVKYFE